MSFLKSTIKCVDCGKEMHVTSGTFGYGLPNECPKCTNSGEGWYKIISSFDWVDEEPSTLTSEL